MQWLTGMLRRQVADLLTTNFRVRLRLVLLALGVTGLGLLIGGMTLDSWRRTTELRWQYRQENLESLQIADRFKDSLRELNNNMFSYGIRHDPADLEKFHKAGHALDVWIDEQKPRLQTAKEKAVMQRIDAAYDDYLRAAEVLPAKLQTLGAQRPTAADFATFFGESERLFDLGQALMEAHNAARDAVLSRANRTVTGLQLLILISLGSLFVLGVGLAAVVYREMIAPLRVQLVESRALVERQEKLASLGMLAAGVAHEIRNPLTAIKAALFIQQKKFQPGTPEHADARIVEREILRLERIVNDFLMFARPSEPAFTTITANQILQEVQTLMAPQLAGANIQLLLEPFPPLQFKADPAQIKQVLINLVQNAADSIGRDGTIRLRARHEQRPLANRAADAVVLEVSDTGKGIPPEVQKRLFDPFFTTKESGTGLGLSIAAGIIQKHGGALQYQTQMRRGTTFGIILPQVTT